MNKNMENWGLKRQNNIQAMAKYAYDKYMRLNTLHLGIADVIDAMFREFPVDKRVEVLQLVEEMYLKDRLFLN